MVDSPPKQQQQQQQQKQKPSSSCTLATLPLPPSLQTVFTTFTMLWAHLVKNEVSSLTRSVFKILENAVGKISFIVILSFNF